jgi:hypothetical protein
MDGRRTTNVEHTVWHFGNRKGMRDKGRESELTREYIIAAIVGVILVTSGLVFKAKPARKIVRARPVKAAKDAVA